MAEPETTLQRIEEFAGTDLWRDRVKLVPSVENWRRWTADWHRTYEQTLGEEGLRAQELLGYKPCSTYSFS
jgi:hypothetical protein